MRDFALHDTICALATAPGHAGRAVVRISGPLAFSLPLRGRAGEGWPSGSAPTCRSARASALYLPASPPHASLTLPVLALAFPTPRSYTGEDSLELYFAGSPFLADRVLAMLTSTPGVRPAQPGEFTARAFLNGRLSVDRAEGVAATIAARTNDQLIAARSLLDGTTGARYRAWADECTTLLALVEAGIDFTDQEDVVAIRPADLAARARALAADIEGQTGSRHGTEQRAALPVVALAGAPNAGKSTLFNALVGKDRAVASPTAGTTRDVLEEELDLSHDAPGASRVLLQDLAGLSVSPAGAIDAAAQRHAREAIARADAVLWCDPTGRFAEADAPVRDGSKPLIRVRTFADQPTPTGTMPEAPPALAVCALDRWNLAPLRRVIADQACTARAAGVAALLPRHRLALHNAREALLTSADAASRPEVAAAHLRLALDELAQLVGAISPDDVIGRVFSLFCVGK